MNYKILIILILSLLVSNCMIAQRITQITHNGKPVIAISCNSETEDFDNIQLFLDRKGIAKFKKKLIKRLRKFGTWSNMAEDYNVSNYEKNLKNGIDFDCLYFEHDNCSYTKEKITVVPKFKVDNSGLSYLRFEKDNEGTIGTDIVAVTQGLVSGYKNYSIASASTHVRKLIKFKFSMQIPKSEVPKWLNELNMAQIQLAEAEREQKQIDKRNKKLFK